MKNILTTFLMVFVSLPLFSQTSSEDNNIFRRAEVMPVFQECDDERFSEHPYRCTISQLSNFFRNSISVANPSGLQTKGHLRFVVETDGSVSNINLVRGVVVDDPVIAEQLNNSIVQLANDLNFISSGINEGENVRVQIDFSVPVTY